MPEQEKYLTIEEVATFLGVSVAGVRLRVKKGLFPAATHKRSYSKVWPLSLVKANAERAFEVRVRPIGGEVR